MRGELADRHAGCVLPASWLVVASWQLPEPEAAGHRSCYQRLTAPACPAQVEDRQSCKTGHYCFRLVHASGSATLCAFNAAELRLWLRALHANGVTYEDVPIEASGIVSIFEMEATLLGGETLSLATHTGCVCLVVNVATR